MEYLIVELKVEMYSAAMKYSAVASFDSANFAFD